MLRSVDSARALLVLGVLASTGLALAADTAPATEMTVTRTFTPVHLTVEETIGVFKEMTGVADLVADQATHSIVATGSEPMVDRMDAILKTFDTGSAPGTEALQIKVFELRHLSALQGTTLLRSKLQVTECFHAPDRARVAVRDTPARIDQARELLAEADVPED